MPPPKITQPPKITVRRGRHLARVDLVLDRTLRDAEIEELRSLSGGSDLVSNLTTPENAISFDTEPSHMKRSLEWLEDSLTKASQKADDYGQETRAARSEAGAGADEWYTDYMNRTRRG